MYVSSSLPNKIMGEQYMNVFGSIKHRAPLTLKPLIYSTFYCSGCFDAFMYLHLVDTICLSEHSQTYSFQKNEQFTRCCSDLTDAGPVCEP